jgi:hypothetical protein
MQDASARSLFDMLPMPIQGYHCPCPSASLDMASYAVNGHDAPQGLAHDTFPECLEAHPE